MRAVESPKICTLIESVYKAYKYLGEKVQKSYFLWHWRVMQSLKKNWLWVPKWHEEFGEFYCEQWQVWKFALWCTTFANSTWSFSLKSTEEISLMTLKKDPNFEENLTFYLKNDMRNLVNFNLSSGKSENLHSDGLLL